MQSLIFVQTKICGLHWKKRNSKSIMGLNIQKGQKWLEDSLLKLNSLTLFSSGIKLDLKWRDLEVLLVSNLKTFSKMCKD